MVKVGKQIKMIGSVIAIAIIMGLAPAAAAEADKTPTQVAMEEEWAYMLAGSGEWRTPNPDYIDATTPAQYAVKFEWGPYRQHVTGELRGIFPEDGGERSALYWQFYSYHNPVTDEITLLQIAWNGAMGTGVFSPGEDGRSMLTQTFFNADGTTREVRHENIETSETEHLSRVYHRSEDGAWELAQEWVWTRTE